MIHLGLCCRVTTSGEHSALPQYLLKLRLFLHSNMLFSSQQRLLMAYNKEDQISRHKCKSARQERRERGSVSAAVFVGIGVGNGAGAGVEVGVGLGVRRSGNCGRADRGVEVERRHVELTAQDVAFNPMIGGGGKGVYGQNCMWVYVELT
ncbi:hypothetical protein NEUTE1DRAFT_139392 [Neurospora tetrasperma FGSC 2508]|uniref:Uncharacterized protein n=1 Tax=Neurospora tetrasperma (strain FGSC 2508 / ATCC MYA-4615 / P0657) TaxID=510951 RepID=F8MSU0_NEUT8|nr:uncharacterized protein NEUTE1DRAFT_139392 [Neurospora tetrasperma FGSC 2508]EGO55123.1 hypothetical protein NEUTE1DRAFT_139392 [Neurospora tetrasperma FGSC 2508]